MMLPEVESSRFESFSNAQSRRALDEALLVERMPEYQGLDASKKLLVQIGINSLASIRIVAKFYGKSMEQVTYDDLARFYADQD